MKLIKDKIYWVRVGDNEELREYKFKESTDKTYLFGDAFWPFLEHRFEILKVAIIEEANIQ